MALSINQINDHLQTLFSKVQALYPHIDFFPVVYNGKDNKRTFQSISQKLRGKPYEKFCKIILQREFSNRHSDFLGLAIYKKKKWLGLSEQERFLAVFSVNSASINDKQVLEHLFWHNFSHTLDNIALRQSPKYENSFIEGPMIPKRPVPAKALSNLKADIFATLILAANSPKHVINDIIKRSCQHPLNKYSAERAALYPLPLAIEHIYFGLETLSSATNLKSTLSLAKGLSEDIITTFDKSVLKSWFDLVSNAQEMAWMGFKNEEILSAAINTSESATIRNISSEICEILGITPSRHFEVDKSYNPFLSEAVNSRNHFIYAKEIFEKLISGAIAERSANRFYDEAIRQNRLILNGQGFGWCAYPLIETAKFMLNNKNHMSMSFQSGQSADGWRDELTNIFLKSLDNIRYRDIKEFSNITLGFLKTEKTTRYEDLHANTLANPDLSYIALALEDCRQLKADCFDDLEIFKSQLSQNATQQFKNKHLPPKAKIDAKIKIKPSNEA
jgi:hypothetical protein